MNVVVAFLSEQCSGHVIVPGIGLADEAVNDVIFTACVRMRGQELIFEGVKQL